MTPTLEPGLLRFFLSQGEPALSRSVGVILFGALVAALVSRVLLQSAGSPRNRDPVRLFGIVVVPLLIVFVVIVIERFRLLA
jgi:hypothetical protein